MATILDDFSDALATVSDAVTGADSLYDKTLKKFDDLYTEMGVSKADKYKLIAEVSAQIAVSISSKAIDTAYEIARADKLLELQLADLQGTIDLKAKQIDEIDKGIALKQRQINSFDDKLKVEVVKARKDVTAMEATQGDTLTTLEALNTAIEALTPTQTP